MPFKIEKLRDEPILVVSAIEPFDFKVDYGPFVRELLGLLEQSSEPVFEITDGRTIKLSFSEVVSLLATVTKGDDAKSLEKHPKVRAWLIAVDNDLLRMGVNALGQAQYGGQAIPIFRTVDEALAYARQQISKQAAQEE
jgi:hypothetical protein